MVKSDTLTVISPVRVLNSAPPTPDEVAKVQFLDHFVPLGADLLASEVGLNLPGAILEVDESGLAHLALGHDPAGNGEHVPRIDLFL